MSLWRLTTSINQQPVCYTCCSHEKISLPAAYLQSICCAWPLRRSDLDVCMNKKDFSERDICSKFIGPAVKRAGWDGMLQIREEVAFTRGRIIVRGKLVTRG